MVACVCVFVLCLCLIFVGREWGPVKFCLFVRLFICLWGGGECEVNICLFLFLFVGGRGMRVLVCWFACFGLVCVFGCLLVCFSNVKMQIHICTFALLSFPPKVP